MDIIVVLLVAWVAFAAGYFCAALMFIAARKDDE